MSTALLITMSLMGCSERVMIPGNIPQGRAWAEWRTLLTDASTEEGLDYELIDQNRFMLEGYLKWVGEHGPGTDKVPESQEDWAMAFLINAFNAAAIYSVIEHRPADSILEIRAGLTPWEGGGFWWGQKFRVDSEWVSLYYLEEQYIINRYQSPLTHVALNPAIAGAPQVKWWTPDNWDKRSKRGTGLDLYLKKHWRSWLASDGGMQEVEDGWQVNQLILDWEEDIVAWSHADTLCEWLGDITKGERQVWLQDRSEECELDGFETDMSLNRLPSESPAKLD
jgi:hypothetical protein